MRPLRFSDYQRLRAVCMIAAATLLEQEDAEAVALLVETVDFLRGTCVQCARELPKATEYIGVCPWCATIQPWMLN